MPFLLYLLLVVAFGILYVFVYQRNKQAINDLILAFSTMTAILVAVTICFVSIYAAWLILQQNPSENAEPQTVLTLSGIMFAFFGLILAGATGLGGAGAYWLKRKVSLVEISEENLRKEAIAAEQRNNESMRTLQRKVEIANSSFIISADIALINLPPITFSQQIPLDMLQVLRTLHTSFKHMDITGEVWKSLIESDNGARICYARALYLLGTEGCSTDILGNIRSIAGDSKSSLSKNEPPAEKVDPTSVTILELLLRADAVPQEGLLTPLHQEIRIRLFQVYRQLASQCTHQWERTKALKAAKNVLDRIGRDAMPDSKILVGWGNIVLSLQEGFSVEGRSERIKQFGEAVEAARNIMKDADSESMRIEGRTAVLFYCVKAFWALRFALGKDIDFPKAKTDYGYTEEMLTDHKKNFDKAVGMVEAALNWELDEKIRDPYTRTIYHAGLANLYLASNKYPKPRHFIEDERIASHIESARKNLRFGAVKGRAVLGITPLIYNDHTESFGDENSYKRDFLDVLSDFQAGKKEMFEYYANPKA